MAEEVITNSAEETIAWGRRLGEKLQAPFLILLSGELGSGKTTLTKGIVAGLRAAQEDDVTSPTFTLIHEYGVGRKVYHVDLYRLENFHDFETLGLEDMFAELAIVVLEWSDKFPLKTDWPQLHVQLEHLGGDARRIRLLGP